MGCFCSKEEDQILNDHTGPKKDVRFSGAYPFDDEEFGSYLRETRKSTFKKQRGMSVHGPMDWNEIGKMTRN